MSAYQEKKSAYPKKDVDIPMSTILFKSPIKHNVLSKNQPIKKRKVAVVSTEEVTYKKKFDNWLGKFNNYKSSDNNVLSLPYPAEDCN